MFCCSKKSSTVVVPAIQIQKPEENLPTQETEINRYEQVQDASLKDSLTPPPFERGETFLIDRRPPARIENYSDLGENSAPIVIDAGSETMKVGFAGSNAPRVISNVVGFSKGKNFNDQEEKSIDTLTNNKDVYVGREAQSKRNFLTMKRPIERGRIEDWGAFEHLLKYAFLDDLLVTPEDHPVLYADAPLTPKEDREKLAELLFEMFQLPALCFTNTSVTVLQSYQLTTGLVVECGHESTNIAAVHEGRQLTNTATQIPFAGTDIDACLEHLLKKKHAGEMKKTGKEIIPFVKEQLCYIPLDYDQELKRPEKDIARAFLLPDGKEIHLKQERFQSTEALFQPSIRNFKHQSLPQAMKECLSKVIDLDTKQMLCSAIVCAGGTTLLPGFSDRLQKETANLIGSNVVVRASAERKHAAWLGGSTMASLPSFQSTCVTKEEFKESGISLIHQRFA